MARSKQKTRPGSTTLTLAARAGLADIVRREMARSSAPPDAGEALRLAAISGHADCVRILAGAAGSRVLNLALRGAAANGHAECVQVLIPLSDPLALNSSALYLAAMDGRTDCVRALIPVSDAKARNSRALCMAAFNGHTDCVKALIPVSDPKASDSLALCHAAEQDDFACALALIPVSDCRAALTHLTRRRAKVKSGMMDLLRAAVVRVDLVDALAGTGKAQVSRRMHGL